MRAARCSNCKGNHVVKAGKSGTRQRYQCQACFRRFVPQNTIGLNQKRKKAVDLYLEGMSIRGIARVIEVSHTTVLRWLEIMAKKLRPHIPLSAKYIEIDELYLYIGSKKRKRWLWLALCRESKRILGYQVGGRGRKTLEKLYHKIEPISAERYYTDGHAPYKNVLPQTKHRSIPGKTNTIEGINSAIRHYLARFRRKSKCYSKSQRMVHVSMDLLMYKYQQQHIMAA